MLVSMGGGGAESVNVNVPAQMELAGYCPLRYTRPWLRLGPLGSQRLRRATKALSFRQTNPKFGPSEASNARQRGLCRLAAKLRCVYTL